MNPTDQQILFFSTLLQLEKQARHAKNQTDLLFTIVNETVRLIKYRQAILWLPGFNGNPSITTISGVDTPDRNAPYIIYAHHLLRHISKNKTDPEQWSAATVPDHLQEGWNEWSFGHVLSCPLKTPNGIVLGGIILSRDTEWQAAETALLTRLTEAYAHALAALQGRRSPGLKVFRQLPKIFIQITLLLLVIFVLDQPVRLSVLAPMEIVPFEPLLVTSPLDSVIDHFFVEPNEKISKGDPLFSLDDTTARNQYLVAQKELAVLETEYHREKQKSFKDAQSRAVLLYMEATMEQKKAGIRYLEELLERSKVVAGQSGIAVFSEVNEWIGKPVAIGEKILTIADPQRVEAAIMLPVADAINLLDGAEILIFMNIAPDQPLQATLRQASYEAVAAENGILAFNLKASLDKTAPLPRIGLRGTAKIYGEQVSVFYYLMRKPLIALRQFIGM